MTLASLPLDTGTTPPRGPGIDFRHLRQDFPILSRTVHGRPLVYLDSAASAQKPLAVLHAMEEAYQSYYANVHRGVHALSGQSTDAYEGAREKIASFINARKAEEVVFVRGATEAINLVSSSYGRRFLSPGDEVVISHLEHHSNIVPWQMLRDEKGISLTVVPVDDHGQFLLEDYASLLTPRTKLVSVAHVSNALGSILPVREIIAKAHAVGALVLLDGCQAAPHLTIDVQDLDVDFYVFSSHKMYGPTAIGALYGKGDLLEMMPPYQGGGDMISSVSFEKTTYKKPPQRFEAGTPAIVEAVGFGAAADYLSEIGLEPIRAHEHQLLEYATDRLSQIPGLIIHGPAAHKAAIISFGLAGVHPHDIGTFLDRAGVAIRAGHHCAQPLMSRLGVAATARASFGLYNTTEDVDALVEALSIVREFFG